MSYHPTTQYSIHTPSPTHPTDQVHALINTPDTYVLLFPNPSENIQPDMSQMEIVPFQEPDPAPTHVSTAIRPQNNHPMITRAKLGIHKPKSLIVVDVICDLEQEPVTVKKALSYPTGTSDVDLEYEALINNKTWDLVPYKESMYVVTNRWAFRVKHKEDGSVERFKARLVAHGFQHNAGVDYFETYSPVAKPSTIKVVFTLVVTFGWDIQQIDVNNVFLNGELKETVFMSQLDGSLTANDLTSSAS